MILLCTNARDITTDYIVLELQRRQIPYLRLNTERITDCVVRFGVCSLHDWSIDVEGQLIDGLSIRSAYFRRPGVPEPRPDVVELEHRRYCGVEWAVLLRNLYGRLEGMWLNSPTKIAIAEDKPRQLIVAGELGFDIPKTLISNDPDEFERFVAAGPSIAKPMRHALIEGESERAIFTSRMEMVMGRDPRTIAAAPIILQREIEKQEDIRVTVVGDDVFAVAIHSQDEAESSTDWRKGDSASLRHEAISLPGELERRCVDLTRAFGLRFGAIDLVRDRRGRFWFLEINPNGQWAWIENRTGLPISAAIVDELCRIAGA